jgi:CDP-diacylglycerol pyrophosphatase
LQGFTKCRKLRLFVTLLVALSVAAGYAFFKRKILWEFVQTCAPASARLGVAFPCEEVILTKQGDYGSVLIKSPLHRTEFLLAPITAVAGLESPSARSTDSAQLWNGAWEARQKIEARLGHGLPRSAVGLAVNSRIERSQDQLHIPVDCLLESVERTLALDGPKKDAPWRPFPLILKGHPYWIMAVDEPDLRTTNVVGLVVAGLPQARHAMAERLLDHRCTSR